MRRLNKACDRRMRLQPTFLGPALPPCPRPHSYIYPYPLFSSRATTSCLHPQSLNHPPHRLTHPPNHPHSSSPCLPCPATCSAFPTRRISTPYPFTQRCLHRGMLRARRRCVLAWSLSNLSFFFHEQVVTHFRSWGKPSSATLHDRRPIPRHNSTQWVTSSHSLGRKFLFFSNSHDRITHRQRTPSLPLLHQEPRHHSWCAYVVYLSPCKMGCTDSW